MPVVLAVTGIRIVTNDDTCRRSTSTAAFRTIATAWATTSAQRLALVGLRSILPSSDEGVDVLRGRTAPRRGAGVQRARAHAHGRTCERSSSRAYRLQVMRSSRSPRSPCSSGCAASTRRSSRLRWRVVRCSRSSSPSPSRSSSVTSYDHFETAFHGIFFDGTDVAVRGDGHAAAALSGPLLARHGDHHRCARRVQAVVLLPARAHLGTQGQRPGRHAHARTNAEPVTRDLAGGSRALPCAIPARLRPGRSRATAVTSTHFGAWLGRDIAGLPTARRSSAISRTFARRDSPDRRSRGDSRRCEPSTGTSSCSAPPRQPRRRDSRRRAGFGGCRGRSRQSRPSA